MDPLKMAPPAVFGLAEEESEFAVELPAEAAPATDDAADLSAEDLQDAGDAVFQAAEQQPEVAVSPPAEAAPATDDVAVAHPEQPDEATEFGAEDLQGAEDDVSEAADEEPGGAATCAYCHHPFGSLDQRHVINGRVYHDAFCLDYARRIATAAA